MLESNFHLDSLLFMFLRFLLVTLSKYLFAGKATKKQLLLFDSFKYLTQQTNTYAKLATVALIKDVKFVKSQQHILCFFIDISCNISDPLSSIFLVYYQHAFLYCDAFILKISFLIALLSILNRFDDLRYFFFYQFQTCIKSLARMG